VSDPGVVRELFGWLMPPWRQDRWLPRGESMPDRFGPLAAYNAEVARGLVHSRDHVLQMAALKLEYDRWYEQARLK
jgi:hypothetical protein